MSLLLRGVFAARGALVASIQFTAVSFGAAACSQSDTPSADASTPSVAAVSQPVGAFGALAVSKDGETLTPIVERDPAGKIRRITGAVYTAKEGPSITVYLGEDGRPAQAVMGDYVILFSGWSASAGTVDLAKVYTPTGRIDIYRGVPSPAAANPTAAVGTGLQPLSVCFPVCDSPEKNLAEGLKLVGLAFTAGACVAGSAVSLGAMVLPCTGLLFEAVTHLTGEEGWLGRVEEAGLLLNAIGCTHSPPECVAFAFNLSGKVLAESDTTKDDHSELLLTANLFLSDPKQGSGTVRAGAEPACTRYQCTPGAYMPCWEGTRQCRSDCTWNACTIASDAGTDATSDAFRCEEFYPGFRETPCPTGKMGCCMEPQICCAAHGKASTCEFAEYCD